MRHFTLPAVTLTDADVVSGALLAEAAGPFFGFRCDPRFGPFMVTVRESVWCARFGEEPTHDAVAAEVRRRVVQFLHRSDDDGVCVTCRNAVAPCDTVRLFA